MNSKGSMVPRREPGAHVRVMIAPVRGEVSRAASPLH